MQRFLRFTSLLAFSLWWGGLTVYAGIVVPIGTELFGSTAQGFITQQVTHWLNLFAAIALVATARTVFVRQAWWIVASWIALVIALLVLIAVHAKLDVLIDAVNQTVPDQTRFYGIHRVYLWVTAVQWLAGLGLLWGMTGSDDATNASSAT